MTTKEYNIPKVYKLCRKYNHRIFASPEKGGKFSARQRDGGDFAMVVGIERFGNGGASKARMP